MPLNILISGGGCAGPTLAFFLARTNHHITIIERYPALRATGAQIDIRAQGIQVLRRMGLLSTIRSHLVDEAGVAMVDAGGNVKATFLANKSGKGAQSLTSEYEIMRGDFVRVMYEATRGYENVQYVFGKAVEGFEQDEDGVMVKFSDGKIKRFDVLVGADGQGSRIRRAILADGDRDGGQDPIKRLGLYMAYWFVRRAEIDNNIRKRILVLKSTQMRILKNCGVCLERRSKRKRRFGPRSSAEGGWETDRLIEGMQTTENFYCQEVVQIRTDTWSRGRVVLLADAAHCPSPITGMGTTSALVGAYVLAGEINRHPEDLQKAFENYDAVLRPFVEEIQKFNPALLRLGYPETWFGITMLHFVAAVLEFLRIPQLVTRFSREEKGGWRLPEYPELKLDKEI
ncbi:putative monooxygenase [Lindgomyces ingoldianus]|uniref:Monooxygenase n=1 Tax=Lindgomyces ingoldianus TaxID=673940 RepID=A0ACB6QJR8_9PLEO|nr:putative monooxygenase [Lindgomyces ingoldianus]KAF2466557.1 putative monooxygenase [Lindgomyces ingoldianus]